MKLLSIIFLLVFSTVGFTAGIGDIIPTSTPKPTITPIPAPIITIIPVNPPVSVPNDKGIVLIIKSILLRPDGVCFVVTPAQP